MGALMIYARKGDRIIVDGNYLGTVARDLDGASRHWSTDDFDDMQVDLTRASQRLPVTSWLRQKMDDARG